jgi:hypothetical protein
MPPAPIGSFALHLLDVGQGESILIDFPEGHLRSLMPVRRKPSGSFWMRSKSGCHWVGHFVLQR